MARNRGIKIINEILVENPKAYTILQSSSNPKRPMTVNFQAPVERNLVRPFSQSLKTKPAVETRIMPPQPSIREISQIRSRFPELPRNTGSSLLQELTLNPRKKSSNASFKKFLKRRSPKQSKTLVSKALEKMPSKKAPTQAPEREKASPQTKPEKPPKKSDKKPCKVCLPEPVRIAKRVASPRKKPTVSITHRLQSSGPRLDVDQILQKRMEMSRSQDPKPVKVNPLLTTSIDGSEYLAKQLQSIKADLLNLDKKISIKDAVALISDVKRKILEFTRPAENPNKEPPKPQTPKRPRVLQEREAREKRWEDHASYGPRKKGTSNVRNPNEPKYERTDRRVGSKAGVAREKRLKSPLQEFEQSPLKSLSKLPSQSQF